mgnify:CR=1 FL=1
MGINENVAKPLDRLAGLLAADMDAVNALIRTRMESRHAPRIPEVTAHLIEAGGKRVRPTFAWAGIRAALEGGGGSSPAAGIDQAAILNALSAFEFIQACALIHDDIIDDASLRRGQPAAHRQQGLSARGEIGEADGVAAA